MAVLRERQSASALEDRVEVELGQARRYRAERNHGRARVCARRAAGWAVGPFYRRCTGADPPASALALLRWYRDCEQAPAALRQTADRLTTHVTVAHDLPHREDPVEDAELFVRALLAPGIKKVG